MIATIGLIFGLTFSALGMNVLAQPETLAGWLSFPKDNALFHSTVVLWTLTFFTWLGIAGFHWVRRLTEASGRTGPRLTEVPTFDRKFQCALFVFAVVLTLIAAIMTAFLLGLRVVHSEVGMPEVS